jgi:hypothetical protein
MRVETAIQMRVETGNQMRVEAGIQDACRSRDPGSA